MATILKCKMCGGDIEVSPDMTVGTCLFCGSTMTLPRIDTDKKARLFNRANQYRLNNEFDKAYDAYKIIVEEDEREAEAYWGMLLSEYGVEYIEDPSDHKRIPTCHRTLVQPIRSCTNYKLACQHADAERKMLYRDEIEVLDRLQKRIAAVSDNEDPYDVFICYKETDDNDQRTEDSVIAQKIYDELTRASIRVFFARITLEDKLGKDYEPYIFAALRSSKVMLVVSTKEEYCNAVWVRNEWSRYLGFMENDPAKTIIPVYKDMSPREFPDELARYQAQDISKVGAIQDLVRGVQKLIGEADDVKKRAMSQKDILDIVNAESRRKKQEAIQSATKITRRVGIVVACVIGASLMTLGCIKLYKKVIKPRMTYYDAKKEMQKENYAEAVCLFQVVIDLKDSRDMLYLCYRDLTVNYLTKGDYSSAIESSNNAYGFARNPDERVECLYYLAVSYLKNGEIDECKSSYSKMDDNDSSVLEEYKIKMAEELYNYTLYDDALALLDALTSDDAIACAKKCKHDKYKKSFDYEMEWYNTHGTYRNTVEKLETLQDDAFPEAAEAIKAIYADVYKRGEDAQNSGDYDEAIECFSFLDERNYSDSATRLSTATDLKWGPIFREANDAFENRKWTTAQRLYLQLPEDYKDTKKKSNQCRLEIEELLEKYTGDWTGHGNWWGDDVTFEISRTGSITMAIGVGGGGGFKKGSSFDADTDTLYMTDSGKNYTLTVSGNSLLIRCKENSSATYVGNYRKLK